MVRIGLTSTIQKVKIVLDASVTTKESQNRVGLPNAKHRHCDVCCPPIPAKSCSHTLTYSPKGHYYHLCTFTSKITGDGSQASSEEVQICKSALGIS